MQIKHKVIFGRPLYPKRYRRGARAVLTLAVAAFCVSLPSWVSAAALSSVWQSTPYRVRVLIAVSPYAELTSQAETQLCADLAARIDAVVGAAWETAVAPAPPALRRAVAADIHGLSAEMMPAPVLEGDKAIFVAIAPLSGGFQATACDFDVYTRMFGPCVARSARQVGMLRDAAMDAILAAFAPLARIERVEKGQAVLRLKAAALPMRDPALSLLHEGDVFRPIIRSNDRDGRFRHATPTPWTFCVVENLARSEVRCRVISGFRFGLAARSRGRTETLALRLAPPRGSTTLVLQSRTAPKQPLAGYDIYARLPTGKSATLVGRTDRQGRLVVPPVEDPLRVLLVKNGGELLARLPIVPGLEPQLTAEVAADDWRLEAEGLITGLQEELVDLVARREVLIARIRARIQAKQLDKAGQLADELRRLPAVQQFLLRLTNMRQKLVSNDAAVQRKIDALLADTRKLIDKHLDPRGIDEIERELTSAILPGSHSLSK